MMSTFAYSCVNTFIYKLKTIINIHVNPLESLESNKYFRKKSKTLYFTKVLKYVPAKYKTGLIFIFVKEEVCLNDSYLNKVKQCLVA